MRWAHTNKTGHSWDALVQGMLDTKEDRARDKARAELADAYDDFDMRVEQHWTEKVRVSPCDTGPATPDQGITGPGHAWDPRRAEPTREYGAVSDSGQHDLSCIC